MTALLIILGLVACVLLSAYIMGKLDLDEEAHLGFILGLIFAPPLALVVLLAVCFYRLGRK